MFDRAKYVVVKENDEEIPIIFPFLLNHSDVAKGREAVSAGFVSVEVKRPENSIFSVCYGSSVSLDIKSRGRDDARLINRLILDTEGE